MAEDELGVVGKHLVQPRWRHFHYGKPELKRVFAPRSRIHIGFTAREFPLRKVSLPLPWCSPSLYFALEIFLPIALDA